MTIPTLDFETYSEAGHVWDDATRKWTALPGARVKGLGAVGSSVYTEHPTTEVLTASYDLCDGKGIRRWRPGQPLPVDLFAHVASAGAVLESHKAMFEFEVWNNVCTWRYGWPPLPPHVQRCSMATAHVNQYPGALANLGEVLRLDVRKDADGSRLLKKFSVPRNPTKGDPRTRIRPEDDPADFERLCAYCDRDVETEQAAAAVMPPMTDAELGFWLIDQECNRRGLAIDRAGVRDCIAVLNQVMAQYGEEARALTGGIGPSQVEATRGWLAAQGVHVHSLDAEAVTEALARPGLPPLARRVLELRALTGSATVKKILVMENQASRDDRLRNLIVHHGARTGRPTGEGAQPLNMLRSGPKLIVCGHCARPHRPDAPACPWCSRAALPVGKPAWKPDMVDAVLEIMAFRHLGMVERFFGDALLCIGGCSRGLFVAGPGNDMIASDYSAIEAVVAAMLSGEQWRIDAFRNHEPIYLVGASKITGTSVAEYLAYAAEHGDHHPDRQKIGKVSELACFGAKTQVLTIRGYVPIVNIQDDDLLWDGVEWVGHGGKIFKGHRSVIRLDGVQITPDHQVSMSGSWLPASTLASDANTLCRALATGSANLPLSVWCPPRENMKFPSNVIASRHPLASGGVGYAKGSLLAARAVRLSAIRSIRKAIGGMQISSPTTRTVGDYSIALRHVLLDATRSKATRITGYAVFSFGRNGPAVRRDDAHSSPISSRYRVGMRRLWSWTGSKPTKGTNPEIFASSRNMRIPKTNDRSATCNSESTTSKPVYDIAFAGPRNRFTIKTDSGHLIVHNCGFGGWINSYKAFGSTEPDDVIKAQILAWRAASPAIVEMWGGQHRGRPWDHDRRAELYGLEGMAIAAIQSPGERFEYRGIGFEVVPGGQQIVEAWAEDDGTVRSWSHVTRDRLMVTLLSGRQLTYHEPRLRPSDRWEGQLSISYMTWNSNPNYGAMGWVRMDTYGGRLFENVVQAVAHDLLRHAIILLRAARYPTVLSVYDEIVVEIPEGFGSVEDVERIMAITPPWAAGWPVRAEGGWRAKRYRKG